MPFRLFLIFAKNSYFIKKKKWKAVMAKRKCDK